MAVRCLSPLCMLILNNDQRILCPKDNTEVLQHCSFMQVQHLCLEECLVSCCSKCYLGRFVERHLLSSISDWSSIAKLTIYFHLKKYRYISWFMLWTSFYSFRVLIPKSGLSSVSTCPSLVANRSKACTIDFIRVPAHRRVLRSQFEFSKGAY